MTAPRNALVELEGGRAPSDEARIVATIAKALVEGKLAPEKLPTARAKLVEIAHRDTVDPTVRLDAALAALSIRPPHDDERVLGTFSQNPDGIGMLSLEVVEGMPAGSLARLTVAREQIDAFEKFGAMAMWHREVLFFNRPFRF